MDSGGKGATMSGFDTTDLPQLTYDNNTGTRVRHGDGHYV